VIEKPVPLGHHRADPLGPVGHLDPKQPLHGDDPAQLVVERRQPVVPVHEDQDLTGVPVLRQLLRATVHVPDHRFSPDDHLAVKLEDDPQDSMGRRVLGPDVEDHLLGAKRPFGHDLDAPAPEHPRVARGGEGCALPDVHHAEG